MGFGPQNSKDLYHLGLSISILHGVLAEKRDGFVFCKMRKPNLKKGRYITRFGRNQPMQMYSYFEEFPS